MAHIASARKRELTERLRELLGSRRYDRLSETLSNSRDILKQAGIRRVVAPDRAPMVP